jgi:hypothetical protein
MKPIEVVFSMVFIYNQLFFNKYEKSKILDIHRMKKVRINDEKV